MANPQKYYFLPKNWLYGAAYGVGGKRYSQQVPIDYEMNPDSTITAYGGTYNISKDALGRQYFDVLIPEYDENNPGRGNYLNGGFNHINARGDVVGRGETYNRYYIKNLIPVYEEPAVTVAEAPTTDSLTVVEELKLKDTRTVKQKNQVITKKNPTISKNTQTLNKKELLVYVPTYESFHWYDENGHPIMAVSRERNKAGKYRYDTTLYEDGRPYYRTFSKEDFDEWILSMKSTGYFTMAGLQRTTPEGTVVTTYKWHQNKKKKLGGSLNYTKYFK